MSADRLVTIAAMPMSAGSVRMIISDSFDAGIVHTMFCVGKCYFGRAVPDKQTAAVWTASARTSLCAASLKRT